MSEVEYPRTARVWVISLGRQSAEMRRCWDDGFIGIDYDAGDLSRFATREEIQAVLTTSSDDSSPSNASLACWEFLRELKSGDRVFVKEGLKTVVAEAQVIGPYEYHANQPLPSRRKVRWIRRGRWEFPENLFPVKTLTELTTNAEKIRKLDLAMQAQPGDPYTPPPASPAEEPAQAEPQAHAPPQPTEPEELDTVDPRAFGDDVFVPRADLDRALDEWLEKKNLILQGPPGVGKTFVGDRFARALVGARGADRITRVQFHASYSYEEFVRGFRPTSAGVFELVDGPFLDACKAANASPNARHVLLIDEINRANVTKVFGELLSLIERDKRSARFELRLAHARAPSERFFVPPNLFLLGLMNTADRNLALVDFALRRRFAFMEIPPVFDARFVEHLAARGVHRGVAEEIGRSMTELNARVVADATLGRGYAIGHSYFEPPRDSLGGDEAKSRAWLERLAKLNLAPLFEEYWVEDAAAAREAMRTVTGG